MNTQACNTMMKRPERRAGGPLVPRPLLADVLRRQGLRSRRRVSPRLPTPSSGVPRPPRHRPAPCHAPVPPLPSCPSEHDNSIATSLQPRPASGFVQQAVSAMLAARDGRNRLICWFTQIQGGVRTCALPVNSRASASHDSQGPVQEGQPGGNGPRMLL